jgi:hypothetical protein
MRRCRSYQPWLLLYLGLSGCTQVVEFDRARIVHDDLEMEAGMIGLPGDGGGPDAARLDAARPDGAVPDAAVVPDAAPVEAGVRCMRDDQCAGDELCCEQECRKTSVAQCSSCSTGCASGAASVCNARTCMCGAQPACTTAAPYCLASGAGSACAQCKDAKDCQGRTDGKTQCVAGSCATCNPADNAGCSGSTPVCNASSRTCERCSSTPDNCPGSLVCTPSGACGGCANAANDCMTPTAPICDSATTQCKSCTQGTAGDSECMTQRQKPYCEAGRCGSCRPGSDMGCDLASTSPACRANSAGQYECQRCTGNVDCNHAPRALCNTGTGSCVECASDANCTDATKPFCDADGTCKGCSAVGGNNQANAWCLLSTLTLRPVCDRTGGRCVPCTASAGCSGNNGQCRVDSAAPQNNVCVDCTDHSGCSGNNDRCDTASNTCIDCDASGGCAGNSSQCLIGNRPAMNRCVQCVNNSACSGQRSRCNTTTNMCVECLQVSHCDDMNSCTNDACNGNVCSHSMVSTPDGGSCM